MIIIENKNTFEDLLGLEIETEDKFLKKKLNSHVCYSGGGGGGSKQQDIAPTLQPYVRDVLGRAKGMVDTPYQAYPGERIVGFTPQELAAQQGIQQMAGQYGLAATAPGLTSSAAYYSPAYSYLGQTGQALGQQAGALAEAPRLFGTQEALYGEALRPISGIQQQLTGAGRLLGESGLRQRAAARDIGRDEVGRFALTGEDIQQYMDPYQQAVVDIEKEQARQDALQTAQAIAAKSAGIGAFGGSRQAILESQAASDLAKRLSDIQTRGSQAAYQQALQTAAQQQQIGLTQAERQRAREQQLGAGLVGLAGARQQLGVGGYGSMAEQLRQAGAGFGSLGGQYGSLAGQYGQLGGGLGALSGQYGSLGQQALGQGYRELGYLSGVGEAQRGLGQERADVAYQDFREAREFPTQQLERYAGMAFGVPSGYLSRPQAMPSGFQQAVGGATTLAGLGRGLGFFNQGGNIGSGGLSTVYRNTAGLVRPGTIDFSQGELANLYRAYEAEKDPRKKEAIRMELISKSRLELDKRSGLDSFFNPDVFSASQLSTLENAPSPEDTGLDRIKKGLSRFGTTITSTPAALAKTIVGGARDAGEYLTTPLDELEKKEAAKEEQYKAFEESLANDKNAQENPEIVGSDLASLISQFQDLSDRSKSLEELKKLTQEAFKFDKDKRAKTIKAQQGFDIAALGMQLMSKPLSEIDPKYVSQLGVSRKELDNLDQEEAMSLYKAKVAELGLEKTMTEIEKDKAGFTAELGDFTKLSDRLEGLLPTQTAAQEASRILKGTRGRSDAAAQRYILSELENISKNPEAYIKKSGTQTSEKLKEAEKRFK